MPRKSRKEEIIKAIREYLVRAAKRLEPITDARLIEASNCARATYYKYVVKDSQIELDIQAARVEQKKYAESVKRGGVPLGNDLNIRKRLTEAEEGNRALLAFIARMTANLVASGVSVNKIQKAQRDAMPHPNRNYSHAGRGRRRR